ncbi:MAG: UTP--glucose-1-phosphate uridylyltransferase [Puniceicoccaceae bacterium]
MITSEDPAVRDRSLFAACAELGDDALLAACEELDRFWPETDNLYHRVRALFFLAAIHQFVLPGRGLCPDFGPIPLAVQEKFWSRRFAHALMDLRRAAPAPRRSDTLASGFARAYHQLGLQFLADQVRTCVRNVPGNRWMFRTGHPSDFPLSVRPELLAPLSGGGFPLLVEKTAVRMDLSHSSWSDIFFLAMDRPEFARVVNVSIDLCLRGDTDGPRPPVEAWFRVIDEPVVRLVSVDLGQVAVIDNFPEIFDFGRDHLGLLKAALIASGIVPPGLEGSGARLDELLERLVGEGRGIELVSNVNNIPKGSRLAVSTNLLAALVAVCMRATRQISALEGGLTGSERSMLAARAILGEWLGGSGGGWQDSGGVWPGIKLIEGCRARPGDPEHGVSNGRLVPRHTVLGADSIPAATRAKLQESLILVHGGLAQNVGPILEMVTERYLTRSAVEWEARLESLALTDGILEALRAGDIRLLAGRTTRHFFGPLKTIIPWASNAFTEALVDQVSSALGDAYWGFWMLGGMSGGGMGLIVDPARRAEAEERIAAILLRLRKRFAHSLPFAIDPVLYEFAINDDGSRADFGEPALPESYYRLRLPAILRKKPADFSLTDRRDIQMVGEGFSGGATGPSPAVALDWLRGLLPAVGGGTNGRCAGGRLDDRLAENGFDPAQHESIRARLREGRIGLAQNRLPAGTWIEDPSDDDLAVPGADPDDRAAGEEALRSGRAGVVTLAAGAGSRWTQGAGVVKALHPFAPFEGRYRNFLEVHLAKTRRSARAAGVRIPHVFTTSHLTHRAIADWFEEAPADPDCDIRLSRGRSVGLRLVPTVRDLRFAWEETPQEKLDEQAQKMRHSVRQALMRWAAATGEAADYRDNLPEQCLHPVGHWYEVPNLLLNGTLAALRREHPGLGHLLLHNIDTLGATLDPAVLGRHLRDRTALSYEVITRRFEDVGGGLARVDGRLRLVEGLALPTEEDEFRLRFYSTLTTWIDIDRLLDLFGIPSGRLGDEAFVRERVAAFAERLPVYITLKEVKKRWGRGQEDVFPVLQFERLWGDMTALPEIDCGFLRVPRARGRQLKDPAQLDTWYRDGGHEHVNGLCSFPDESIRGHRAGTRARNASEAD